MCTLVKLTLTQMQKKENKRKKKGQADVWAHHLTEKEIKYKQINGEQQYFGY